LEREASRMRRPVQLPESAPKDADSTQTEKPGRGSDIRRSPAPKPHKKRKMGRKSQPPNDLDRINVHLSDDEVEAWLRVFQDSDEDEET
jgi:hypothetical protein